MNDKGRALTELLTGLTPAAVPDVDVTGIVLDSRAIKPGDLFLAYRGTGDDGRSYISDALARGAVAVAYDPAGFETGPWAATTPAVAVPALRNRAGVIAHRFYGRPSDALFVVGITGTNGKTTCAFLLAQAYQALGKRCGVIGTLGAGLPPALAAGTHTTPDPVAVHRELRRMKDLGATHVCMEVTSHALDQCRVAGVQFSAALFTNLTHDHLDYHGDLAAYGAAKAKLFEAPHLAWAAINHDDAFGRELFTRSRAARNWSYGAGAGDVRLGTLTPRENGLDLEIAVADGAARIESALIGRVNAVNLLAVACALTADGVPAGELPRAMGALEPAPGRMEVFRGRGPRAVVDYAHTPDALERALESLREHCRGALWCVFGCGGDRDRAKRPRMGEIAERLSDQVILTDDNPRSEDPEIIVREIAAGMRAQPTVIHDRVEAIVHALSRAADDDWVLIAGKGHETTQQFGTRRVPLSDRAVVRQWLEEAA